MKYSVGWISNLAGAALLLAGCENTPLDLDLEDTGNNAAFAVAAGERIVEEYIYELTGSAFSFACSADGEPIEPELGELVYLEGKVMERITYWTDPRGGDHFKLQVMPIGLRGISEVSGEEFRVVERAHSVSHKSEKASWGNYRQVQKLVGRATGRSFRLVSSGIYRVGADGSYQRERHRERVECKP